MVLAQWFLRRLPWQEACYWGIAFAVRYAANLVMLFFQFHNPWRSKQNSEGLSCWWIFCWNWHQSAPILEGQLKPKQHLRIGCVKSKVLASHVCYWPFYCFHSIHPRPPLAQSIQEMQHLGFDTHRALKLIYQLPKISQFSEEARWDSQNCTRSQKYQRSRDDLLQPILNSQKGWRGWKIKIAWLKWHPKTDLPQPVLSPVIHEVRGKY